MSMASLKAKYNTDTWEEATLSDEGAAIKITRIKSERKFSGGLAGTSVTECIIVAHPESGLSGPHAGKPTSSYTGICHLKGSFNGSPEGEVVFIVEKGTFVGTAEADWITDEKSAIGGLKGPKGKGGSRHDVAASCKDRTNVWFDYSL